MRAHLWCGHTGLLPSNVASNPIEARLSSVRKQQIAQMWRHALSSEKISIDEARLTLGYKSVENLRREWRRFGYFVQCEKIHVKDSR
jgi:hypothetical protein